MMTKNMGGVDIAIRAVLGSLVMVWAALAADQRPLLALGAGLVAVVALATAIAGACPLYKPLGIDTRAGPRPRSRIPLKAEPAHQLR